MSYSVTSTCSSNRQEEQDTNFLSIDLISQSLRVRDYWLCRYQWLLSEDRREFECCSVHSRLVIETDCPWCEIRPSHASRAHVKTSLPAKNKKKQDEESLVKGRNEPCNGVQVLEAFAGVLHHCVLLTCLD